MTRSLAHFDDTRAQLRTGVARIEFALGQRAAVVAQRVDRDVWRHFEIKPNGKYPPGSRSNSL